MRRAASAARRHNSRGSRSKNGGPHRPITQSPTILSNTPPVSQMMRTTSALQVLTRWPISAGVPSTCSLMRVKPEMSQ